MKTTIWLFITLLLIPMGSTVELAVSTKSDITIFFNNGNEKTISFDKGTVLDFSQVENTTKALVKKSTALLEDRLIWTNFLDDEDGKNDEKTFPFIPGVQKLLPFSTRHMIAANQTSLLSVNVDNDEVRLLYQGTKILDVAFDACSNSLLMIDNKQVFISSLQHFNPIPVLSFTQLLLPKNTKDRIAEAQLLATHSGNVIILTENLQRRLNSDGFAIKDADGQLICASDPSKAYNIRSIELDNDGRLFLTDAMNYLVWQLQLNDDTSEKICDLKAWKRLSGQQPPQKLTILHQSQTCISRYQRDHNNQKNSYEIMSQLAPLSTTNSSRDDPCYNYCINGHCSTTSLGVPICHCGQNFTGQRCENQLCFNYCLNQGRCNIPLGTPSCTCPPGFDGKRCEVISEASEMEAAIDYFQGFLIMSGINVIFLLFIVALAISLIFRVKKQSKETKPKIIAAKKSSRPRVFSASSNNHHNGGQRNKSGGSLNEAFNEDKSSGHMCQALISDDGVVLDLEDCCLMTVCEKPCIEAASFRKPTHRNKTLGCHGESHNDLLANVEFY